MSEAEINTLKENIAKVEKDIDQVEKDIVETAKKIVQTEKKIAETEIKIDENDIKIKKVQEASDATANVTQKETDLRQEKYWLHEEKAGLGQKEERLLQQKNWLLQEKAELSKEIRDLKAQRYSDRLEYGLVSIIFCICGFCFGFDKTFLAISNTFEVGIAVLLQE